MKRTLFFFFTATLLVVGCKSGEKKDSGSNPVKENLNIMADSEGNKYKTVKIGDQVWMAENMRSTKDAKGEDIVIGGEASDNTPYCYYPDGDSKNVEKYGYLYNWEAAKRVCPSGWHLPTDEEWKQLEMTVGMSQSDADTYGFGERGAFAATLSGDTVWENSATAAAAGNMSADERNSLGFGALPAGGFYRSNYIDLGKGAYFWSATEPESDGYNSNNYAYYRNMRFDSASIFRREDPKRNGFSVRCVKD